MKFLLTLLLAAILTGNAYAQHPWLIRDINTTGTANGPVGEAGSFADPNNAYADGWGYTRTANGVAFFASNDVVHGSELWRSDGTAAGTFMLADITPGAGSTVFGGFYEAGSLLYFKVYSKNDGTQGNVSLWRTDGTAAGTFAVMTYAGRHYIPAETAFESNDGMYNLATRLGSNYYFMVADTLSIVYNGSNYMSVHDRVYKTDGTVAGTSVYYDAGALYGSDPPTTNDYGNINRIIAMGGKLYIFGINNTTLTGYLQQGNGGPSQNVLSVGDGTAAPTILYAPGGQFGVNVQQVVNVNDNYLLMLGQFGANGSPTNLYRLKPGETTPVTLQSGNAVSLFANTVSGGTNTSYYASGSLYFYTTNSVSSATNGEPASTFTISGFGNGAALYTGILNDKMTFYANDDKLYSWDGMSAGSYQVVSDSLTGRHVSRVVQIGNRAFYLNGYGGGGIQTSDLTGSNCFSIYLCNFLARGSVINNSYIDYASGIDGSFNSGEEPHILNATFKLFTATVSNDWNTAGNWIPAGVPTATDNVVIPTLKTGQVPVISANAFCKNLTMSNTSLIVNAGANLDINGYIAKYRGTIKGAGSISLKTIAAKIYGSPSAFPFNTSLFDVANVNINGADLSFGQANQTINSAVNFQTDNKILAPYTALTFTKKPYITGYNGRRYIVTGNGNLITYVAAGSATSADSLFTIPIGTSTTSYTPVSFGYRFSDQPTFGVTVSDGISKDGGTGPAITSGVLNKKWTFSSPSGTFNNVRLTLGWNNAADELTGFNRAASFVDRFTSSAWLPGRTQSAAFKSPLYTVTQNLPASALNGQFIVSSDVNLSPTLSGLAISTGTLSPAFATTNYNYTTALSNANSTITVTPTAAGTTSTIKVNGAAVTSGSASPAISLNVGSNVITTIVTAADSATTLTYTITVTRLALTPPAISYAGPQTYTAGTAITALIPANTGGAVPATAYAQASTFAGNGTAGSTNGTGTAASFSFPDGMVTDASGNIYVSDANGHLIRKITPAGIVSTFAGSGTAGSANGTGTAASFGAPGGLAIDASGNLYVADESNNLIRKITPGGVVSTFAGSGTLASTNGTGTAASFYNPRGVATDASGNVFVSEDGELIRKITPAGVVTTFAGSGTVGAANGTGTAASFNHPWDVATDASGNVYVADTYNILIRKITPGGVVSTLAGSGVAGSADGNGVAASFNYPAALVADALGNIYVADLSNNLIRMITPAGVVSTIAGSGTSGSTDGVGGLASFSGLYSITTDAFGNIYAGDAVHNLIRKINATGYAIAPALPPGLTFDATTGTISGTPAATSPATNYTITAYNLAGSSPATVSIRVNASGNASLSGLKVSSGTLSPTFASGTTAYTANVANAATSITVTPTTSAATSTIKVNGTSVASGIASNAIALNVGPNIITTVVTAQDGITTQTYTVTVTRAKSAIANLASMNPTITPLSPTFTPATTSYTLSVANTVASMTVKPITSDANATIKVNGITLVSGTVSAPITLAEGTQTVITVVVTAQDGTTTKTYTITVTRAASAVATLSNIKLSTGTLSPVFATGTVNYTASVPNTITSVTLTPTTTDANATVTVNGATVASGTASGAIALVVGANKITTIITAQNGTTTKTYTVTVTRSPSVNANLASMGPSVTPLSPTFTPATTSYTLAVKNTVTSMTVKPVTSEANATIKVNGTTVVSGTVSQAIVLAVGSNVISVIVTAQDGATTKTYTINATRASGGADSFGPGISVSKPTEAPAIAEDGIAVHEGISPNGDGINDFLLIDNIGQYPESKLTIMNRNGQLVYEAKGYDNSSKTFDGHSSKNGQMQLPGTYFYQLDYTINGVIKHKTGFIVLKY